MSVVGFENFLTRIKIVVRKPIGAIYTWLLLSRIVAMGIQGNRSCKEANENETHDDSENSERTKYIIEISEHRNCDYGCPDYRSTNSNNKFWNILMDKDEVQRELQNY